MQPELPASPIGSDSTLASQLGGFLDHAQFVRHLASGLIKDEHRREDVEQQTWLAAMENPPARAEGMGAWLKTVCRNFALRTRREDQRRRRRETVVAKPEGLPAVHEVVEREAMLQGVVKAVLELPESHREVILLRYYEDLPPREIAKRLGVPPSTVHSRLQRAHAGLKERLDKEHGSRSRWVSGLILLTGVAPVRASSFSLTSAVAAGLVLVLASIATWQWWPGHSSGSPGTSAEQPRTEAFTGAVQPTDGGPSLATIPFNESGQRGATAKPATLASQRTVSISGRVLSPGRKGGSQSLVNLFIPALYQLASVEANEDGRFTLELALPRRLKRLEFGLHARTADGSQGALRRGWIRSANDRVDAGDLILRDASALRLSLPGGVSVLPNDPSEARVYIRAYDYLSERYELRPRTSIPVSVQGHQAHGWLVIPGLPACEYIATLSTGAQRGSLRCSLPLPASMAPELAIRLRPTRRVRARVVDPDGVPLSGIQLRLRQGMHGARTDGIPDDAVPPIPLTDLEGRTLIDGASSEYPLFLSDSDLLDHPNDRQRNHRVPVPTAATEVRVVVQRLREVIWQLKAPSTAGLGPKDGEVVRVTPWFGRAFNAAALDGVCTQGRLRVAYWPADAKSALAVAVDGSMARLRIPKPADPLHILEAQFLATQDAEVLVKDPGGVPQAGVTLEVGNTEDGVPHLVRATTDATGVARFSGLMAERLAIMPATDLFLGTFRKDPLGWIDSSRGERSAEVTIQAPVRVRLQCTLNGVQQLPPSWLLVVPEGALSPVFSNVADGTLDFSVWPDRAASKLSVMIVVRGLWHAQHEIRLPIKASEQPVLLPCALGRAPELSVSVLPPDDAWYDLRLESYLRRDRIWKAAGGIKKVRRRANLRTWEGMTIGTYRVRDLASGLSTAPFKVNSQDPIPNLTLDLRTTGWASGRVETPDHHDLNRSVVELREGAKVVRQTHVDSEGRFKIRVSTERALELVAVHPSFASGGKAARAAVAGPTEGVVLKLGPHSLARFRLPHLDHQPICKELNLHLRSSSGQRRMDLQLRQRADGSFFFGGYRPGIWDLIINAKNRPPQILHDLDLERHCNLGTLPAPESIGTLRLTVLLPPNQPIPPFVLEATGSNPIKYRRITSNLGQAQITLPHLAPGLHTLKAYTSADALVHHSRRWRIDLPPNQVTELTWDLR